ncbi:hypothetical protein [Actinocrispum sp. NPDC049592]|uniref:hypothetical protein n=1 Tax=Actinocrispum sp. NPDC049592 TaxID=3154835 RepID=UPI003442B74E
MIPVQYCTELSFSPGLTELAVIAGTEPPAIGIHEVPSTQLVRSLPLPGIDRVHTWSRGVVHLGAAVVHLEQLTWQSPRTWRIVRHRAPDWQREVLAEFDEEHSVGLRAVPGGFVVVRAAEFLFGGADGPLRDPAGVPEFANREVTLLDAHAGTGRIAVVSKPKPWAPGRWLTVLRPDLTVLAEQELEFEDHYGWFCGPDLLVTFGEWQSMTCLRIADGELRDVGGTHLLKQNRSYGVHSMPLGLTTLPLRNLIAVEQEYGLPTLWLDAVTGKDTEPPPYRDRFPVWASPNGQYLVFVADHSRLELATDPAFAPGDVEPDRV